MTEGNILNSISAILGPLIGAGAGSYFGLKGALNGIKDRTSRIEAIAQDNHDALKDIDHQVREMRRELCE